MRTAPPSHEPKDWVAAVSRIPAACSHIPEAIIYFRPNLSLAHPLAICPTLHTPGYTAASTPI